MHSQELDYLSNLEFFGIKLGLEQTRSLFIELGNPDKDIKFIHVAGSNGKGSVCAMLESALLECGFKVGFYSSPHLVNVGERFRINGKIASDESVAEYVRKVRPAIDVLAERGMKPTYFEVTTAIAAMMFNDAKVDFVIWETGMGGRLDSTNIVEPEATVITGISLEHAERLGGTIEKIAFEKAGIIKSGVPLFRSEHIVSEACGVIDSRAAELNAPINISSMVDDKESSIFNFDEKTGAFTQKFLLCNGVRLEIPLGGAHQRRNASLAYSVLEYLAKKYDFSLEKAVSGMKKTSWDARCQFIVKYHLVLDAAHNPEGVQALAELLAEIFPDKKFNFIFGAFSEKDTRHGIEILAPLAKSFTFVQMDTVRASKSFEELARELHNCAPGMPGRQSELGDALFDTKSDDDTWRVLCGSLHLCGDALAILRKTSNLA